MGTDRSSHLLVPGDSGITPSSSEWEAAAGRAGGGEGSLVLFCLLVKDYEQIVVHLFSCWRVFF